VKVYQDHQQIGKFFIKAADLGKNHYSSQQKPFKNIIFAILLISPSAYYLTYPI